MKKGVLFRFVGFLLGTLFLFNPYNSVLAQEKSPIRLSLSNMFPATQYVNTEQVPLWIKDIEEATDGKVKIVNYPGETLLKGAETYEGVVMGRADIGMAAFGYSPGRFPFSEIFELTGIYLGSCTANIVVTKDLIEKFNPPSLSDVKLMYIYAPGPTHLYTRKPVHTLEDLKGMKIRAVGLTSKCFKLLGAAPVSITQAETYEGLSKGVVDGTIAPPEVLKGYGQAEVTKYIIMIPPLAAGIHFCVMNLAKWNSLPTDVKKAIDNVNDKFIIKAGEIWDAHQKEGMDYGIKKGMEVIKIPPAEADRWLKLLKPLEDEFLARMKDKGLPGEEMLKFVKEKAAEYSKKFPAPIYNY
jgi:TRAP-type C4-dicarboxylate transport system substrate-binding protein